MNNIDGGVPPDPNGAAGPNGVIATVNLSITYYQKTGVVVWGPVNLQTFWTSVGNTGSGISDPRAIFDPATGRFYVIMQESTASQSFLNVAVSKTSSPASSSTGDWLFYRIEMTETWSGVNYGGDYPGLAVDGQAVYVTYNLFQLPLSRGTGTGRGSKIIALNKSALNNGIATYSTADPGGFSLKPASVLGTASPGNVAYFVEEGQTTARLWALTDPLGGGASLYYTDISVPDNGGAINGAPQLGTQIGVSTLSPNAQGNVFWYQGSVWFCMTAGASSGRSQVYYYRINANNFPSGAASLGEAGSIDGGPGVWT